MEVARRRTLLAAGWIVAFLVSIVLLGFPIAVPLLVFVYVKFQGKESWLFSIVFTAAVWGFFYGLFDLLLHLPFPEGWLYFLGALFILVVVAMPQGLAGVADRLLRRPLSGGLQ